MVERCVVCKKFQKKDTVLINGSCPICFNIANGGDKILSKENGDVINVEQLLDSEKLNVEDVIQEGRKGVSNFQMIPVIKKAADSNDFKIVELMRMTYPEVFESTLKYIGKKRKQLIEEYYIKKTE